MALRTGSREVQVVDRRARIRFGQHRVSRAVAGPASGRLGIPALARAAVHAPAIDLHLGAMAGHAGRDGHRGSRARALSWQPAQRTGGSGTSWGAVALVWQPTHPSRACGEALSTAGSTKSESRRPGAGALRLRSLSEWQPRQSSAEGVGPAVLAWASAEPAYKRSAARRRRAPRPVRARDTTSLLLLRTS